MSRSIESAVLSMSIATPESGTRTEYRVDPYRPDEDAEMPFGARRDAPDRAFGAGADDLSADRRAPRVAPESI